MFLPDRPEGNVFFIRNAEISVNMFEVPLERFAVEALTQAHAVMEAAKQGRYTVCRLDNMTRAFLAFEVKKHSCLFRSWNNNH